MRLTSLIKLLFSVEVLFYFATIKKLVEIGFEPGDEFFSTRNLP